MSLKNAVIAANRFGFGATPGLISEIQSDPQGWLIDQLEPNPPTPAAIDALPTTAEDYTAFSRWLIQYGAQQGGGAAGGNEMGGGMAGRVGGRLAEGLRNRANARDPVVAILEDEEGNQLAAEDSVYATLGPRHRRAVKARFDAAVTSDTPFLERLIHFWSNHFVVSAQKISAYALPPSFERDTARRHVTGSFLDMLMASSKHPAMLHYLDNSYSIGQNSEWGRNPDLVPNLPVIGRATSLNENLAREILELHTVGVNGGYTQEDVTNFAKVITGWMGRRGTRPGPLGMAELMTLSAEELFYFNEAAHEPGPQTVMGKTYDGEGVEQGEAVLRDLAKHPKTAKFIATKLVRHFIADDPPAGAVARVARAFLESEGDLIEVSTALIRAPEAWEEGRPKFKQPEEYLISAVRALGGPDLSPEELDHELGQMGQRPYMQPGPDGWDDTADEWIGGDPLWKRLEWANATSQQLSNTAMAPLDLARDVLGDELSADTVRVIAGAESPAQGLSLMLVSLEFLRR